MNPITKPDADGKPGITTATPEEDKGIHIPNWAWGAAAGGAVVVSGAAVSIYHLVSRKVRMKQAQDDVLHFVREENMTPRGDVMFSEAPPSNQPPKIPPDETSSLSELEVGVIYSPISSVPVEEERKPDQKTAVIVYETAPVKFVRRKAPKEGEVIV